METLIGPLFEESIANQCQLLVVLDWTGCWTNNRIVNDWDAIGSKCYHCHHAVSANRIMWVYAGFWWYHGILVVHLQDSVGAFGAKLLKKRLHHAKAPPYRGVLRWEWGNKDVQLVTTFAFCHVSKCYFFQQEIHSENVSAKSRSLVQVTPMQSDFEVIFM